MSGAVLDAIDAALNAAVGDDLARRDNPLAIETGLYDRGAPVRVVPPDSRRLVVLVHGLGCTERCWAFPEDPELDYGRLLARDLGLTPLYVRYNTGLPIHESGRRLSALLAATAARLPELEELILIGHSLGGLVIRAACHDGEHEPWRAHVRRAFYIGSPHLGSPVAQAGHAVATALNAIQEPVTRALAEVADLRSAAVRDLRRGDLTEDGAALPLDPRLQHFAVGGTLPGALAAFALGDGLVRTDSATAATVDPTSREHVGVFAGVPHLTLAHHPEVYAWIASRCGPRRDAAAAPSTEVGAPRPVAPYVALGADAVIGGATTIQAAHEAIASRPYDVLEAIPPLAGPTRVVRAVHFQVMRGTYDAIRAATGWVGRRR